MVALATYLLLGNEALEYQVFWSLSNPEKNVAGGITPCQNEVEGNIIDAKIRKRFHNAVKTVKIHMLDAFLTAMDNVVAPRVELAVRSINGFLGQGTSSAVQNPDRRSFFREHR